MGPSQRKICISHTELLRILQYDPLTGIFTWRVTRSGVKGGSRAGRERLGYRDICVMGVRYQEANLAWFYMTQNWPSWLVDHKDRNGLNNVWTNLREADSSKNAFNQNWKRSKKLNLPRGVSQRESGHYSARCCINYVSHWLGTFDTVEEASAAYEAFAESHVGDFLNK